MNKILKGQLMCSLAMVLVGSSVVVSKVIGDQVEPFLATALRHALALPVFLSLMWWKREPFPRVGARDAILLLGQAAAGSVGYTVLLMYGVALAGATDAGIVTGTLPAVATLFAMLFLGERPNWRLIGAIAMAASGVMVVALAPSIQGSSPSRLTGMVLVLGAVACEAVFILANKRLSRPVPAMVLSALMSAGGLLLSILPAWLSAETTPSALSLSSLIGIVYYAWVPTVIGFVLWYKGCALTTGTRASFATVWLPVSALMLSALYFGESVQPRQWAGLGFVLLAMLLAATTTKKK